VYAGRVIDVDAATRTVGAFSKTSRELTDWIEESTDMDPFTGWFYLYPACVRVTQSRRSPSTFSANLAAMAHTAGGDSPNSNAPQRIRGSHGRTRLTHHLRDRDAAAVAWICHAVCFTGSVLRAGISMAGVCGAIRCNVSEQC
jgi:hypothetical protein